MTGDEPCAQFQFRASELDLEEPDRYRLRRIHVRAEFTEAGTDVTLKATKDFEVEYTKMKLSSDSTYTKYFKPDLPYIDQVLTYKN